MNKKCTLSILVISFLTTSAFTCFAQITDLQTIKSLYTAPGIVLPSAKLNGIVLSDTINKNVSKGSAIVQSGNQGINFYTGVNAYSVGDSVSIDITGDSLIIFKNAFEIKRKKGITNPAPIARGIIVVPKLTTIADINANIAIVQCTLVRIANATASPAGSFSGAKTLTDATGNITLYTGTTSTFASTTMPTTQQDWIGYTIVFNTTNEFEIRSLSDITAPLPLSFTSFKGSAEGVTALLSWSTADEVNTNKFILEKSIDAVNFSPVATILSKGGTANNYSYNDAKNDKGTTVYYRLKSIDNDASFHYSNKIKVVFANGLTEISVYPNPAVNTIKVNYNLLRTNTNALIVNAAGKTVKQFQLAARTTSIEVNVATLVSGVYTLKIEGLKATTSFVKK